MKNILKKNQVIITALAIMIVVAGYLTFTQDKAKDTQDAAYQTGATVEDAINTATDEILNVDDATSELIRDDVDIVGTTTDISDEDNLAYEEGKTEEASADDAKAVDAKAGDTKTADKASKDTKSADASSDDSKATDVAATEATETAAQAEEGKDSVGEAVLVNKTIGADFFSSAMLNREQTRAMNREILMEVVNSKNVSEKQKQDALDKVLEMTSINEKEDAVETSLLAKGFTGAVISIIDGEVEAVVGVPSVTEQAIAQIENIVKHKTGIDVSHITITPVVVSETE